MTRLTPSLVAQARRHVLAGGSAAAWAASHDVAPRTVQWAVYGHTWPDVVPGPVSSHQKPTVRLSPARARQLLKAKGTSTEVAERFGIADSTVRHYRTGRIRKGT